jgi:outer membrane protein TolC
MLRGTFLVISAAALFAPLGRGAAQSADTLVARALAVHPAIRAAAARAEAARHRVEPAGLPPDPMLMAGVQNMPLGTEPGMDGPDAMTMRMVGVGQTIPFPGKLSARRRVAARELDAAQASLTATTRQVARDVKDAYYELAFLDRAMEIVARNQNVLVNLIRVTESRYSVGTAGQRDVLKARVEAARLAETAVSLTEQRRATLARLNAMLDRPSETPVRDATVPPAISRAAVARSAADISFVSAALGARAAGSPLPPLAELQEAALRDSPEVREQAAMIAAQVARVDLARHEYLPDFDLNLQYGQRPARPDMLTAFVSVPIPLWKGRKQDQLAVEARAEVAALEAQRAAKRNEVRAEVARLVSELERQRAQLAIYVKAVLPQSQASLASATASYQVGKVEFLAVLDDQATLFSYETEYFRALTEFAKTLAELERVVGKEILR